MINQEVISFFTFCILGVIFSIVFDFFRAIRKNRKLSIVTICIQDITYFVIIGVILLVTIISTSEDNFRLYLAIGIVLGIIIYVSIIGNKIVKLFVYLFKFNYTVYTFIFLPLTPYLQIFHKQLNILEKNAINCCKKISYMVNFYYNKLNKSRSKINSNNLKTKEGNKCRKLKNKLQIKTLKRSTK